MSSLMLLLILAVLIAVPIVIYNGLVQKRIAVENAWSQITIQLKRRHDLIPNLVEIVKGYAGHEKGTLEAVIAARNSAVNASSSGAGAGALAQAENALSGTLKSLFALQEAYPDLKANQNFLALQEELSSTENRIGFSRQHYNDTVGIYQAARQSFPSNIVANMFGFGPKEFFELDETEQKAVQSVPQVKF